MSNITQSQYWNEVECLASHIVSESADQAGCNTADTFDRDSIYEAIHDTVLHETIDGHQWVIYCAYNLNVLQYSDNSEYMIDEIGVESAGSVLKESGLSGLHAALAFWALYADVSESISDVLDTYEESLQAK